MDQLRIRLYEYVSRLVELGIPVTRALELAAKDLGDLDVSYAMTSAADRLLRGERLADAVCLNEGLFPPLARTVLAVTEELSSPPLVFELLARHYRHFGLSPEHDWERGALFFELLALGVTPKRAQPLLERADVRSAEPEKVSFAVEEDAPLHELLDGHVPEEIAAFLEGSASTELPARVWSTLAEYVRTDRSQATPRLLLLGAACLAAGYSTQRMTEQLARADPPAALQAFLVEWARRCSRESLAATMRRAEGLFSPAVLELVQVAEQSGTLERAFVAVARGMLDGMFRAPGRDD